MKWADVAKERVVPTADVEKVAKLGDDVANRGRDRLLSWVHEAEQNSLGWLGPSGNLWRKGRLKL